MRNVDWSVKEKRCGKAMKRVKIERGNWGEVRGREGSASQPILSSLLSSPHARRII
jgi:hypothetical protein